MRRLLVPTCLLLGGALLAPAFLSLLREPARAAARSAAWPAPSSDARACKPQPPVVTVLEQSAVDGDVVELSFSVAPHADAGALTWSLVLPPGAELVAGPASGRLAEGSAGTGPLVARVRLPSEDARVALDVRGALAASAGGTDARESLRVRRTLTWGTPRLDGQRLLVQVSPRDAKVAQTPAHHREGR